MNTTDHRHAAADGDINGGDDDGDAERMDLF